MSVDDSSGKCSAGKDECIDAAGLGGKVTDGGAHLAAKITDRESAIRHSRD
jgi:hypothetical protein